MLRKLKAVPHTRGLAYDPQGEFVAAMSAQGLLQIWEMLNGKKIHSRKRAGPDVRLLLPQGLQNPEGLADILNLSTVDLLAKPAIQEDSRREGGGGEHIVFCEWKHLSFDLVRLQQTLEMETKRENQYVFPSNESGKCEDHSAYPFLKKGLAFPS